MKRGAFNLLSLFILLLVIAMPFVASANSRYAALIIDADTGKILHQENAGAYRYPASLTKMMTLYVVFDALEKGRISMNQRLTVSQHAMNQAPSKIGFSRGSTITVKEAILSLIVKSANDSAVVLAEAVGGSEGQFASLMNKMAAKIGMNHTNYRNASGLHDPRQKTTSYDLARLAMALHDDFPKYYGLFNTVSFDYNGRTYYTHNRVLKRYDGADGLKTGYVNASGYNLVTSAHRDGSRLVGVVMGGRTGRTRDVKMMELLDKGFGMKMAMRKGIKVTSTNNVESPVDQVEEETNLSAFAPVPILKNKGNAVGNTEVASNIPVPTFKPASVSNSRISKKALRRKAPMFVPIPTLKSEGGNL